MKDTKKTRGFCALQTVDKKLFSPRRGRIALSANEKIAKFLDFAIQAKFAAFQSVLTFVSTIFFCMLNSTAIIAQMPMAK